MAVAKQVKPLGLFINGQWTNGSSGKTRPIVSPIDEEIVAEFPDGTAQDAQRAVDAAVNAFPKWSSLTAYERAKHLLKTAELMRQRVDEIAQLMALEMGKPIKESRLEVLMSAGFFEWYSEEAKRNYGEIVPQWVANKRHWVIRQPIGVVAIISPWNFPVSLFVRGLAPALAVGCTAVCRPSSQTPLSMMATFKCLHDSGLPEGVVNMVTGKAGEIIPVFFNDSRVRKINFTGSTEVGRQLIKQSADQIKRLSLELGGHAPVLIFPDVDVEKAAQWTVKAKFRNNGQTCISPNRIYVHKKIFGEFSERVVYYTKQLKMGNSLDPETDIGPLFAKEGLEKVEEHVKDAISKGAKVLCGGKTPEGQQFRKGYWYEPTVLTNITKSMLLTCEETFGPVLPLIVFEDKDEVIQQANDSIYGLAAYLLTNDLKTVIEVTEKLETGMVGVWDFSPSTFQCPFGGVKQSGIGVLGGWEGLKEYLVTKHISIVLD